MLNLQLMCAEKVKHNLHMLKMCAPCLARNKNVIKIHHNKLVNMWNKISLMLLKNMVQALVRTRGMTRHSYKLNLILKVVFSDIIWSHMDLIKPIGEIHFSEIHGTLK